MSLDALIKKIRERHHADVGEALNKLLARLEALEKRAGITEDPPNESSGN